MKISVSTIVVSLILIIFLFPSCKIIEQSSVHAFEDGYYSVQKDTLQPEKLYSVVSENEIAVWRVSPDSNNKMIWQIPLTDSLSTWQGNEFRFTKSSLDIDLSSVLLKYRPGIYKLPAQWINEFNLAIYTGWRKDRYRIYQKTDPVGRSKIHQTHRGFDAGLFAGAGSTLVNPFSTRSLISNEYNALFLQLGGAGFLETRFASFGIAVGKDYLTGPDFNKWIYQGKWWLGMMVGVAIN
jgi:hypothetical protein